MEIPHKLFERRTWRFSSCKNRELKVELCLLELAEKEGIFCKAYFVQRKFF